MRRFPSGTSASALEPLGWKAGHSVCLSVWPRYRLARVSARPGLKLRELMSTSMGFATETELKNNWPLNEKEASRVAGR